MNIWYDAYCQCLLVILDLCTHWEWLVAEVFQATTNLLIITIPGSEQVQ